MISRAIKQSMIVIIAFGSSILFTGCGNNPDEPAVTVVTIEGRHLKIMFDNNLHSKVTANFAGEEIAIGDYSASEFISVSGKDLKDFIYSDHSSVSVDDRMGAGKRTIIIGSNSSVKKHVAISLYDDFPGVATYQVTYTNENDHEISVDSWTNNHYAIFAKKYGNDEPPFWSYQSGSYRNRPDWVLPIQSGFTQENYLGMNASDYGGGTPISVVWRKDVGIGVGHLELTPKLVSLPVEMPDEEKANLSVKHDKTITLAPGDSFSTLETFVTVHQGDYFAALDNYRRVMVKKGIHFDPPRDSAYEPVWCAWGYERNFTMQQIYNTLPKVKELGYEWAVLDDGWQTAEGDWYLNPDKFPNGDSDMITFVKTINEQGLKAKLWWAPLAVDPGTDLIKEHPEYLLLNEDGSKRRISWWDAYYLCPAYEPVRERAKNLVTRIMKTWGYEGLKIDGQHLNAAPPCYNPAHNHAYPEESSEQIPAYFKDVYDTALGIHEDGVVEICPCGTAYSFFNLPYMNQPVSSDPESSWQIRLKGKTLKALMGHNAPYYGDHVELSDGRRDFASTVGIGGIVGTKFTWPVGAYVSAESGDISLTQEKETEWAKWVNIYLDKMLSKAEYRGQLYDIGFDRPEAHAIRKDDKMYYAFYADNWDGEIELRGLGEKKYTVTDYINNVDYGSVTGPTVRLAANFKGYLLVEAVATGAGQTVK